ncbi:hypothetical protein BRD07_03625 [Halobacteriales archaeon QS_9_68_42]|nr:MAG: hypothetical protein BRD07_03625 [Halobacteriales archaeon QS_9_68_42]
MLVAGAGCSALPGSGGDATSAETPDGATVDEVPGVEDGRLTNQSALLGAHVENITETGYAHTVDTNITDARQGETVEVTQRQRTRVAAGAGEYETQLVTDGATASRFITWGNESVAIRRGETAGSDPQYRSIPPRDPETLAGRALLERRLSAEFEAVDVQQREDAPNVVTMEVEGLPEDNAVFDEQAQVSNVREYNAQLVVDTRGRIHSFDAVAVYDIRGESADYEFTFQMISFEDPGIERPEWAAGDDG